jgi:hypothetical protein
MNEQSFERLECFGEFRDGVIVPLIDEICAYAVGLSDVSAYGTD